MTFIHSYLLVGLVLAGLPVLIHLIMRQKPKQLPFPAFRFLRQKAFINRRKLQIQHLLLMLLRVLLIAALCMGLARPRIVTQQLGIGNENAVAAVLVLDTSMSMEYTAAGVSRIDEAKDRARELLDEMSDQSDLVILDSGDEAGGETTGMEWIRPSIGRNRIDNLRLRPANAPINRQVERAFRLLKTAGEAEEAKPRFLYIFSDRTRESWDASEAKRLERPAEVTVVFVDVGVDKPRDLAIDKVEIEPPVVAPGGKFEIKATVRSTGGDHDTKLTCQLDPDPDPGRLPDERAITLGKGQGQLIVIERLAPTLPEGVVELPFQVKVQLATNDALPFNNVRYATFMVREPRKVLTIADKPKDANSWKVAINAYGAFRCEVVTPMDADKLDAKALAAYKVICFFEITQPSAALWDKLQGFVRAGGGLALVPGGEDVMPGVKDYNADGEKRELLPARWETIVQVPKDKPGLLWSGFNGQHPLTAPFREWSRTGNFDIAAPETQPVTYAFWDVKPFVDKSTAIATYAEEGRRPSLVERPFGRGLVIQFTTRLTGEMPANNRPWHNYWTASFGMILVDLTLKYLAGDTSAPELNYVCGVPALVAAPPPPPAPPYTLQGPNLAAAETNLAFPDGAGKLTIPQAAAPGNFTIIDGKKRSIAGFSVNVRPEESQLDRVPVEEIEPILGQGSVLAVGRRVSLADAMKDHWAPPMEMMPWLMMMVLIVLVLESFFANKFYRRVEGA